MKWIIFYQENNSFGDKRVIFLNTKTDEKLETTFSEGEHHQMQEMLTFLNLGEQ